MLKQTYTEVKEELINFVIGTYESMCPKCQEIRFCNPDDNRVESGEFCSSESCPLVNDMKKALALAIEMQDHDTFNGQELLNEWKRKSMEI